MAQSIFETISSEQMKGRSLPNFRVGDNVKVHVKIKEGDKERIQVFAGTVIARDGKGHTETFTVRRISYGEGVERVFPICCSSIEKLEVERSGQPRRAKLYYLRGRSGKKSKIRERSASAGAESSNAPA
ncbi:MAG: 50S ribosomal protein L19 [Kiritimatiellae bacterium]|nr:50S ribosomal protein L19 [Kiritimatiellia bacterium]MDW8458797.1 50S ribosomal protein L19 [Verrucomicrobiota bacterium]